MGKAKRSLISTRYILSKRDLRELASDLGSELGGEASSIVEKAGAVEIAKTRLKDITIIIADGRPLFFRTGGHLYPTLLGFIKYSLKINLPRVYVDEGAVPHIVNGADVMVPGIKRIEGALERGRATYIADDVGERVFAIGRALMSAHEILASERGRAVRNIHYVGDKLWRFMVEEL